MELKITLYEDRFCRKVKEAKTAPDFGLSLGLCEEVLKTVNIDMFVDKGFFVLSNESKLDLLLPIIKDGLPYFKELLAELFEISVEDMKYINILEVGTVIINIITYAFGKLQPLASNGKNSKN